jgi:hypothetical protein
VAGDLRRNGFGRCGLLSSDGAGGQEEKHRQQRRAGKKGSLEATYAQIHISHIITGLP